MTSPMHSPLQSPLQPVMRSPLEFRRRGGGFDPASLFAGGKKGYVYDFTDTSKLFQSSAGTGVIMSDADPIGYAVDLSGNGFNATQSNASLRPSYYSGSGAVGTGTQYLNIPTLDLSTTEALTVIVCTQTSSGNVSNLWSHSDFNDGGAALDMNSAAGYLYVAQLYGTVDPAAKNARGKPADDFRVVSVLYDRSKTIAIDAVRVRIDGELDGNAQVAAGGTGTPYFSSATGKVGGTYAGGLKGKIARIIVVEGILSTDELFSGERWAAQAGDIPLISENPPSGNVYYSLLNSYGQSLSVGITDPAEAISTTNRFGDEMFTSTIHCIGADYSTLIPMVSTLGVKSGGDVGETPVSGTIEQVHELGYSGKFIGAALGWPENTIALLSKGEISYNASIAAITAGMRRAREKFKHFKVRGITWMQGESDGANNTYAADLHQLQIDLSTDVKAITRQTEDVWLLSYQLDRAKIGLAQLTASDTYDNIKVAMPMYFLPHYDGVHLTSLGYKIAGAYFGHAYSQVIVQGNTDWQPLRDISSSVSGAVCDVVFNPVGSLAFDTTLVAAQTNQGFKLYQSNGTTPITISSVAIVGTDTVRITASGTIPAGAILRYGFSDPSDHTADIAKGNLRDSQGDTLIFDGGGLDYPLHNWCLLFQRTIS